MKASTVIAIVAASVVSAQSSNPLSQIPQCALTCAITSLGSTGCQTTDFKCICSNTGFVSALTPCVQAACTPAELQQTITAAEGLCSSVGVSLSVPPVSSSMPATSAPATTSASSVAPATTPSTFSSVVTVAPPVTNTTTTAVVVSPTANATVSVPTTALPSPTPTGNAAGRNTAAFGLGAVLAFAAALL